MDIKNGLINRRYRVVRELTGGSSGAVYEVCDLLAGNRTLALKCLGEAMPSALLRFEFEQLARLDHPNLVRVFDLETAGSSFFTQEFVIGEPANAWIDKIELSKRPQEVARIAVAIARVLGFLHSRGLLHRDVKPSNILVNSKEIKLIDLGLARMAKAPDGNAAGTFAYMAPEALDGFADHRSELFSLGVTMNELLQGSQVPGKLQDVIDRLTRPQPGQRLQSAKEVTLAIGKAMGAQLLGPGREFELLDASSESESETTRFSMARSARLVGRQAQLKILGQLLDNAKDVDIVALTGPMGVGRTRLFKTAVIEAQIRAAKTSFKSWTFLRGTLRELLGLLKKDLQKESLLRLWLGEDAGHKDRNRPMSNNQMLLGAMAKCFLSVEHPTAFLIEDGDNAVVNQLLHSLARFRTSEHPPVVIATKTDADFTKEQAEKIDALMLNVMPLQIKAETSMMESVLGYAPDDQVVKKIHALTGGVPLLTESVLAALLSQNTVGKITLSDIDKIQLADDSKQLVLVGLLAGLDAKGRSIVEALAVLGGTATDEDVIEVASLEPSQAYSTIWELERRGWISQASRRLSMPGYVADQLEKSLDNNLATRLHGSAFNLLKKRTVAPNELANHAIKGKIPQAAKLTWIAAKSLQDAGDLLSAALQFEQLLNLQTGKKKTQIKLELAKIYRQTGMYSRVISLAQDVEKTGGESGLEAKLEKAAALRLSGQSDKAMDVLDEFFHKPVDDLVLHARAIAARIELDRGDLDSAAKLVGDVEPRSDWIMVESGLCSTAGLIMLSKGENGRAAAFFEAGLKASRQAGDVRNQARFYGLIGMIYHGQGRWPLAQKSYEKAIELADEAQDRHGAATYCVNLAAAFNELGRIGDALVQYRDGLARLKEVGRAQEMALAGANYAQLLLRIGDLEGADQASKQAQEKSAGTASAVVACVRADVLVSSGRIKESRPVLEDALKKAKSAGAVDQVIAVHQLSAAAFIADGDKQRAKKSLTDAQLESTFLSAPLAIEQRKLELKIADEKDVPAVLDKLFELLFKDGQPLAGYLSLNAYVDAAKQAQKTGQLAKAKMAARAALKIMAMIFAATPSMHYREDAQLSQELTMIANEAVLPIITNNPDWERLVRINTRLNFETRIGRLLELIMDTAIEITSAQRGFLLVMDSKDQLRIRCARNIDKEGLDKDEQNYSRSVAMRAYQSGEPVLTTDAQEDESFSLSSSVLDLNLRYIVAVPLNVMGKVTGTIYLDSRRGGRFEDAKIALLTALADQAAIALTNARLTMENRKRQRYIEKLNRQLSQKLESFQGELEQVKRELDRRTDAMITRFQYKEIVAGSQEMAAVFKLLDKVTDTSMPVVLQGESGTGKELAARAIHFNGPRKRRSFVAENCAAIPETLIESTLFGHVKGAFTGAIRDAKGLFMEADGGTLFLDEIADLPMAMQAKLLRVLQEGEVRALGGGRSSKVDARIIVASNADLEKRVKEGKFREDLFYRLSVIKIELPPLRKRSEDIPLLVEHFLNKHAKGKNIEVAKNAMEALMEFSWPGNVRQLENEVMRSLVLSEDQINLEHLSEEIVSGVSQVSIENESLMDMDMNRQVEKLKQRLISAALQKTGGNQTAAASLLGLSRYGLQKMIARLEI